MFDAIIRSKLMYGLETIHLTKTMYKEIDGFQYRGLRKILGMHSTFINRANTNRKLLETATAAAFPTPGDRRRTVCFSEYHQRRHAKLLGHVLRSANDDPLRQLSFMPYSATRIDYGKRRRGHPRQNWLHFTKSWSMKISYHDGIIQALFKKMGLYPHSAENFKFLHLSSAAAPTPCATPTDWVSAG